MPFNQFCPRPFTPVAVQTYAPAACGLYGLTNAREWIFIGQTDNIQGSLIGHLEDPDTSLMKRAPTGFVFEVCDRSRCPSRQERLVSEYGPVLNQHSPSRR